MADKVITQNDLGEIIKSQLTAINDIVGTVISGQSTKNLLNDKHIDKLSKVTNNLKRLSESGGIVEAIECINIIMDKISNTDIVKKLDMSKISGSMKDLQTSLKVVFGEGGIFHLMKDLSLSVEQFKNVGGGKLRDLIGNVIDDLFNLIQKIVRFSVRMRLYIKLLPYSMYMIGQCAVVIKEFTFIVDDIGKMHTWGDYIGTMLKIEYIPVMIVELKKLMKMLLEYSKWMESKIDSKKILAQLTLTLIFVAELFIIMDVIKNTKTFLVKRKIKNIMGALGRINELILFFKGQKQILTLKYKDIYKLGLLLLFMSILNVLFKTFSTISIAITLMIPIFIAVRSAILIWYKSIEIIIRVLKSINKKEVLSVNAKMISLVTSLIPLIKVLVELSIPLSKLVGSTEGFINGFKNAGIILMGVVAFLVYIMLLDRFILSKLDIKRLISVHKYLGYVLTVFGSIALLIPILVDINKSATDAIMGLAVAAGIMIGIALFVWSMKYVVKLIEKHEKLFDNCLLIEKVILQVLVVLKSINLLIEPSKKITTEFKDILYALVAAIVVVAASIAFLKILNGMMAVIKSEEIKHLHKRMMDILKIIAYLTLVVLAILVFIAVASPIVEFSKDIILSILIIFAIIGLILLCIWAISKASAILNQQVMMGFLTILVAIASLTAIAFLLILLAEISVPLLMHTEDILLTIGFILIVVGIIAVAGIVIGFAAKFIIASMVAWGVIALGILTITGIGIMMMGLTKMKFDKDKIIQKVKDIIECAKEIFWSITESLILDDDDRDEPWLLGLLRYTSMTVLVPIVEAILGFAMVFTVMLSTLMVFLMGGLLMGISHIKFNKETVRQKIKDIIECAGEVHHALTENLLTNSSDHSEPWLLALFRFVGLGPVVDIVEAVFSFAMVTMILMITGIVYFLGHMLRIISNIELDPDKVRQKVQQIILLTQDVFKMITSPETKPKEDSEAEKNKSMWGGLLDGIKDFAKGAMNIVNGILSIGALISAFICVGLVKLLADYIMTIVNVPDTTEIMKKVEIILGSSRQITTKLFESTGEAIDPSKANKIIHWHSRALEILSDYVEVIEDLSDAKAVELDNTVNSFIKFIDKVNGADLDKLKQTTEMFRQMAAFSESISGDFDKLADALNEKIAPLLEKISGGVEKMPKAIKDASDRADMLSYELAPDKAKAQVSNETFSKFTDKTEAQKMQEKRDKAIAAGGYSGTIEDIIAILTDEGVKIGRR